MLKRNNAKKTVDSKYKLMKYELITIYQNLFNQLSYKETLEVANLLVKYLKERENWNIKDIVTEDGIMELLWGKNHPLV